MDMEKTGTYLASLRRGRDMTQQQVADILGVSNKTVSKWESGAGLPDIAALPALAALYGVTADDILAGETRPRACADTPAEVEAYLERRGSLRFRIGYSLAVMALAVWVALGYTKLSTQEYPPPKQAGDTLSSHLSHHVIIHSRVGHFQRIHQLVHYGPRLFRRAG